MVREVRTIPRRPSKRLFIDFVSAHQIGVIAEIAQEPAELPEGLGSAVEPAGEGMALVFFGFENDEPQDVERSLRMPAIEGPIDADQEDAFQDASTVAAFAMQTGMWRFMGCHLRLLCE